MATPDNDDILNRMAGLTDEERAALTAEDPDEPDTDIDAGGDVDPEDPDDSNAEADADAEKEAELEEAKAAAEAEAEAARAAAKAAKAKTNEDPEPAKAAEELPAARQVPLLRADVPVDAKAQLEDIDKAKADLNQKWRDAEIDHEAYAAQLDALNEKKSALDRQMLKAEIARDMQAQQEEQAWVNSCAAFFKKHPELDPKNTIAMKAFDDVVGMVQDDPASKDFSFEQILDTAYGKYREAFRTGPKPVEPTRKEAKGDKAAEELARQEAAAARQRAEAEGRRRGPRTIAEVPAADISETDDNEFIAFDRIMKSNDPALIEREMEKFEKRDPVKFDEYMKRAG